LLGEFDHSISELVLIPSSGGVFEVKVGDELVFSKKKTGRHADFEEVLATIRDRDR
jgi:selenoprotein W-related protein